jgi:hypothetical protein
MEVLSDARIDSDEGEAGGTELLMAELFAKLALRATDLLPRSHRAVSTAPPRHRLRERVGPEVS